MFPSSLFFQVKGKRAVNHKCTNLVACLKTNRWPWIRFSLPSLSSHSLSDPEPMEIWENFNPDFKGLTISPFSSTLFKHTQYFMQHGVFNISGDIHLQTTKHFAVINNTRLTENIIKQILFNGWFYGSWKWRGEGKGFIQNHTELVPWLQKNPCSLYPKECFVSLDTGLILKRLLRQQVANTILTSYGTFLRVILTCCPLTHYQSILSNSQKGHSTWARLMVMPVDHPVIPQGVFDSVL